MIKMNRKQVEYIEKSKGKQKELTNQYIDNYLKQSVIKPYLYHIEFEILNILTVIQTDKIIRNAYQQKGFNIKQLEITINTFLIKLKQLERIFET